MTNPSVAHFPPRRVTRLLTFDTTPAPANSKTSNKGKQPTSSNSTIDVVLRIRPFKESEVKQNLESCILPSTNDKCLKIQPKIPSKHPPNIRQSGIAAFRFSKIFPDDSSQEDVFERTTLPLISHLFRGESAVVFAYGVTSSGKTYTIQGTQDSPGILPRSLDVIINSIAIAKGEGLAQESCVSDEVAKFTDETHQRRRFRPRAATGRAPNKHDANYVEVDSSVEYSIYASYLEIYNDLVYDLFDRSANTAPNDDAVYSADGNFSEQENHTSDTPSQDQRNKRPSRPTLKLKERVRFDSSSSAGEKEVFAEGQTEVRIKSVVDIERLLEFGCNNRTVAHTRSNSSSSRSHAIFEITLKQESKKTGSNGRIQLVQTTSRLQIVDLAGTEKISKASQSVDRAKESRQINTSLMNLSRCLETIRKNQFQSSGLLPKGRIVPFRDSKLTRLLQRSLSTGFAVMIATMSPSLEDADETIHTLRNTAVAREVKIKPAPVHQRIFIDVPSTIKSEPVVRKIEQSVRKNRTPRKVLGDVKNIIQTNPFTSEHLPKNSDTFAEDRVKYEKEITELKEKLKQACTSQEVHWEEIDKIQQKHDRLEKIIRLAENAIRENEAAVKKERRENEKLFRDNEHIREKLAHAVAKIQSQEVELRMEVVEQMEDSLEKVRKHYEKQLGVLHKQLRERDNAFCPEILRTDGDSIDDSIRAEGESLKRRVMRTSAVAFENIARELHQESDESESDSDSPSCSDSDNDGGGEYEEDLTVYEEDDEDKD